MARKIGTSVVLTQDQLDWLDDQPGSISENVREALTEYIDNE